MTPIQQLYLGVGAKKKTYMEDVFSNYLYTGQSSTKTITNGIDNLSKGGMLWIKNRDNARGHQLYDTERLASGSTTTSDYSVSSDSSGAARDMAYNGIITWKSDGWSVPGGDGDVNQNGFGDYTSWNFRKAPGFFDVITYTGNSTAGRTLSHSLGCVPGLVLIKQTNSTNDWVVYHRSLDTDKKLKLNGTTASSSTSSWNSTRPTSTTITLGTATGVNAANHEYVAYVFAGGESTTDKAVEFDGTGDYLSVGSSSAYTLGTGDFTIECWAKFDDTANRGIFQISSETNGLSTSNTSTLAVAHNGTNWHCYGGGGGGNNSSSFTRQTNKWYHLAFVRHNGTTKLYVDGTQQVSFSDSYNYSGTYLAIGGYYQTSFLMDGKISNFRVVKGEALYTRKFVPLTNPVTRYSSTTKLLCCNGSSTTASTVVSGTITANGDPTVTSNNSIFDDPAGFVFGDAGDQNIIKCGSYVGDSENDGPEIHVGFEPQWILIKTTSAGEHWWLWDTMRGITQGDAGQNTNGKDRNLYPNLNSAEENIYNKLDITPTGFKIQDDDDSINANGDTYIYMCIRRPDGYVGKPADAGTDVFTTAVRSSSTAPRYISNFPVDFALYRDPASTMDWFTTSRLTGSKVLKTNTNEAEADNSDYANFDHNNGYSNQGSSGHQSWMWKRGQGFDVVTYVGNGTFGHVVNHSMNKIPEMIWLKERNSAQHWYVNHTALTGGGTYDSWRGALRLNSTTAAWESANVLGNFSTSSTFTLGADTDINGIYDDYIALLFASVSGISSVGSYNGSSSSQTITTGFQPRFVIIRRYDTTSDWYVLDTTRGWGSGNDQYLKLNQDHAQSAYDIGEPTSNGFEVNTESAAWNASGNKYIYYAHA